MSYLLFLSGSTREGSTNTKLAMQAFNSAQQLGAQVHYVDLKLFPMPLYDPNLEAKEGLPPKALELKALFAGSRGFFMASPEYNSSISPLLKNTIDWISRSHQKGEAPLQAFRGKVGALAAASPSALGGLRGLVALRSLLSNMGVFLVPDQLTVPNAYEAFDEQGNFKDFLKKDALTQLLKSFIDLSSRL